MEKKMMVALVMVAFLVAMAVFASADSAPVEVVEEAEPSQPGPECGPGNCNLECGGDCGIPSCGCGR
jgi:hypothetical protein